MFVWIFFALLVLLVTGFVVLARKGRKLRTTHVLPDTVSHATVQSSDGKNFEVDPSTHFYFGKNPDCQIILANAREDYSVCVFYHRKRFAFETLSSSRGIQLNGEEQMAGYLKNGDVLEIADETFTFQCW